MDGPYSQGYDYDPWGNVTHKYGWGGEVQGGGAGQSSDIYYSYTGNRRNGFSYDARGNLSNDIGQTFTYDATGQQTASTYTNLQNWYDGDGLRVKRTEDGLASALFLRSSVLGGQVVAELDYVSGSWQWWRGYVYLGSQLMAVQQGGAYWMHEDPVTKSKRVTNSAGAVVSTIEVDPWGADTSRSNNAVFQPKKFTSYERDANGSDEAMFRRYNRWHSRFDQPDPYDGSYDTSDPQSFNRFAYVQGDPVNFVDPSGLTVCPPDTDGVIRVCHEEWGGYSYSGGRSGGLRRPHPLPLDPPLRGGDKGDRPPTNPDGKVSRQQLCDDELAGIFGGPGAVASGSGFEPPNMPGKENLFRGGPEGHLNNAMHLYGSGDGYGEGEAYIPAGGRYIGRNPYSSEDSYMFYYSRLGNARNVTLFASHIGNFSAPRGVTTGRTRIGNIGGDGGRSAYNPNSRFNQGPYIHAHFAIHQGRGYTGHRLSFFNVFCE